MRNQCLLFCLVALLLAASPSAVAGPVEFKTTASANYRLTGSIDGIDGKAMAGAKSNNQDGSINIFDGWGRTHRVAATASEGLVSIGAALADAAVKSGDLILVGPGTYLEHDIDFHGKAVTLTAEGGPQTTIIDCQGKGRALSFSTGGSLTLEGFTFRNCASSGDGGAIFASGGTNVRLSWTIFEENAAANGGAVAVQNGSLTIERSLFRGNVATAQGGAVLAKGASLSVTNSVFVDNEADEAAGLWVENSASPFLAHNTFHNNRLQDKASPVAIGISGGSGGRIANSILWSDAPQSGDKQIKVFSATTALVEYSTLNKGTDGVECLGTCTGLETLLANDPSFVFPDDLHLAAGSPCINSAKQPTTEVMADADGIIRPQGGRHDMGAFEFTDSRQLPVIARTPARIEFRPSKATNQITTQTLTLQNAGGGTLEWSMTTACDWLRIDQVTGETTGSEPTTVKLMVDAAGLPTGNYSCNLVIASANAVNTPQLVPVTLSLSTTAYVSEYRVEDNDPDEDTDNDNEFHTIQKAIDAAADGGVIVVRPGTYKENAIDFKGKKIVLTSEMGPTNTIIDGTQLGRVFLFEGRETSDSIINGFSIKNGKVTGGNGGAILVISASAPLIRNCVFKGNQATGSGGALYVDSRKAVRIEGCTFGGQNPDEINKAAGGGGLSVATGSSVVITECLFKQNTTSAANASGGAILNAGKLTVISSHFLGNSTNSGLTGSGSNAGGAIANTGDSSEITVVNSVLAGNSADNGGAVAIDAGTASITNCTLYMNKALTSTAAAIGGIHSAVATITLENTILAKNTIADILATERNTNITPLDSSNADSTKVAAPVFVSPGSWSGNTWLDKNPSEHPYRLKFSETNSPYIDQGKTLTDLFSDLRGAVRPIDGDGNGKASFDIGAYEYSAYFGGLPGDQVAEPFQNLAMNGSIIVTDFEYEISWKDKSPFPNDDNRVLQPNVYEVRLALVNDWGQRIDLDLDRALTQVAISQQGYKLPFTFGHQHIGTWRLRLELATDSSQYVLSDRTYTIAYKETTEYVLGQEISPPKGFPSVSMLPDGVVKPEVDNEEYVYWSVNSDVQKNRLFAVKPGTTVITWYDDAQHTTPYPIVARIVKPPDPRLHIAETLSVELLSAGSRFDMVELKFSDNEAAVNANQFTAVKEGWSVLLFRDNDSADDPEVLEVVRTLTWDHDPVGIVPAQTGAKEVAKCDPETTPEGCTYNRYSLDGTGQLTEPWPDAEHPRAGYLLDPYGRLFNRDDNTQCSALQGAIGSGTVETARYFLDGNGKLFRDTGTLPTTYYALTEKGQLLNPKDMTLKFYSFNGSTISSCPTCTESSAGKYFVDDAGVLVPKNSLNGDAYFITTDGHLQLSGGKANDTACYYADSAAGKIGRAWYYLDISGMLTKETGSGFQARLYLNHTGLLVEKTSSALDFYDIKYPVEMAADIGVAVQNDEETDASCGSGYVFFELSPYDGTGANRVHDRATRQGPIIPVNLDLSGPITESADPKDDLMTVWYGKSQRTGVCWPYRPIRYTPKWPTNPKQIVIASGEGSGPLNPAVYGSLETMLVYNQTDHALPGFNPNEEHASFFTAQGSEFPGVFPLRNDLNKMDASKPSEYTSEPYVLLKYRNPADNVWKMEVYKVEAESATHPLRYPGVAGQEINPVYPLNQLTFGPCAESETTTLAAVLEDKDHKFFAKHGGLSGSAEAEVKVRYFYRLQNGFVYDRDGNGVQDAELGTCIAWQDAGNLRPGATNPITEDGRLPMEMTFAIRWPDLAPTLHIGETLTGAKTQVGESVGLPNIKDQCIAEVLIDQSVAESGNDPNKHSVNLIDPLREYSTGYILANPENDLPRDLKPELALGTGRWVFAALPYHLKMRLSYDPVSIDPVTRKSGMLKLKGHYEEGTGEPTLLLNTLTSRDIDTIKKVFADAAHAPDTTFMAKVDALKFLGDDGLAYPATGYPLLKEAEMKALTAGDAQGVGYVTLAFNNHKDCPSPTMLSVLKVGCPLYTGELKVIESDNPFDEKLTLRHNGDFGGGSDNRWFQWKYLPADFSGIPAKPGTGAPNWEDYFAVDAVNDTTGNDVLPLDKDAANGRGDNFYQGAVDMTTQGTGQQLLPDRWFSVRYASEGVCSGPLSDWTEPQLYEGWMKRVMKKVNLFDQKVQDFHATDVDTMTSMVSQAGKRFEGDIALSSDPEYLKGIGMIETYETLLNRGKGLVGEGGDYADINKSLLFAANRVSDLYMLLGNEAYADSADPTIGFSTKDGQYGNMAPSIFAFQNQVDSLLDEELALLRGRDDKGVRPFYNHLLWNFTLGDGEVAYKENYNITDQNKDGAVDENDAMLMYPQGHGDAWGHYLSAVTNYYELLKRDNFTWIPQSESILVAQVPVEVDYRDERKFAAAAAAKAKTGAEVVALTYRQRYTEDPQGQWQGYKDTNQARNWGVDEWARRTGQGAFFDWVAGNAMLPTEYQTEEQVASAGQKEFTLKNVSYAVGSSELEVAVNGQVVSSAAYSETASGAVTFAKGCSAGDRVRFRVVPQHGIQKVDRTTVLELGEIAQQYTVIEAELDKADIGLNPMGLSKNAVPFDIDPAGIARGETHFEQIYGRAVAAMNNAIAVFNYANQSSMLLRRQQDTVADFKRNIENQEVDFNNRLVEVFGYPYPEDCGPGKTYSTDYCGSGPDLYHFMYVDPSELMGEKTPKTSTFTVSFKSFDVDAGGALTEANKDVTFSVDTDSRFGIMKPADWTGRRKAPGEAQVAQSDLLQTRGRFEKALQDYDNLLAQIELQADLIQAQHNLNRDEIKILNKANGQQISLSAKIKTARARALSYRTIGKIAEQMGDAYAEFFPKSIGMSTDTTSVPRGVKKLIGATIDNIMSKLADNQSTVELDQQNAKEETSAQSNISLTTLRGDFAVKQQLLQLESQVRSEVSLRYELYNLAEAMQQSSGRYLSALAKGDRIMTDRLHFRQQTAAQIIDHRYRDMSFRIFRNDALQKYRAQYDLAAMYVYLAAKAYDYETSLLGTSTMAGQRFLTDIVRQRTIGTIEGGQPLTGTGLADPMKRMWQNFQVIKPQLGFNNPQQETNRFSLRQELFRIKMDSGSNTTWQKALEKYRTTDLWNVPEFRRYCRPFAAEGIPQPGLVIPFSTTVTSGLNFFDWPLGGGDSYYSSANFATRVRSVGVWFSNYNAVGLAQTPRIYLVPTGEDILRSPSYANDQIRTWQVVDQKLPLPFPITEGELESNPNWIPSVDTLVDELVQIRRHSDFKAYHDSGYVNESEMRYDTRLVGRSVWNTKWVLIIPGQSLLYDADDGLDTFINGPESMWGNPGDRTGNGITDIKLFFETYAYPGD